MIYSLPCFLLRSGHQFRVYVMRLVYTILNMTDELVFSSMVIFVVSFGLQWWKLFLNINFKLPTQLLLFKSMVKFADCQDKVGYFNCSIGGIYLIPQSTGLGIWGTPTCGYVLKRGTALSLICSKSCKMGKGQAMSAGWLELWWQSWGPVSQDWSPDRVR